jgi:phage gp29-like protein
MAEARAEYDATYLAREVGYYAPSRLWAWDAESVGAARNAHLEGSDFRASAALMIHLRKDAAIYAALGQRVAPFRGLASAFQAPRKAGSPEYVDEARAAPERMRKLTASVYDLRSGAALSTSLLAEVIEHVALAGLCITRNRVVTREDGGAVELRPEVWPLDCVRWDAWRGLQAETTEGLVPIVHGDGSWTVFAQHAASPWVWGALVPLSFCWIDRAFGVRDRRNQSQTNGSGKPIGILPEGVKATSPEGRAAIALMKALHKPLSGGVAPHGMEIKWLESTSQAWQIYREIISGNDRDIPRVLLGQDGTTRAEGGNYVKDGVLMGVRNDIVEGDLEMLSRGLLEGVFRPFAWLNSGDVGAASRLVWRMPDPDRDQRIASYGTRSVAYTSDVQARRAAGSVIDQALLNTLAARYEVEPMTLAPEVEVEPDAEDAAEPAEPPEPYEPATPDPGAAPEEQR